MRYGGWFNTKDVKEVSWPSGGALSLEHAIWKKNQVSTILKGNPGKLTRENLGEELPGYSVCGSTTKSEGKSWSWQGGLPPGREESAWAISGKTGSGGEFTPLPKYYVLSGVRAPIWTGPPAHSQLRRGSTLEVTILNCLNRSNTQWNSRSPEKHLAREEYPGALEHRTLYHKALKWRDCPNNCGVHTLPPDGAETKNLNSRHPSWKACLSLGESGKLYEEPESYRFFEISQGISQYGGCIGKCIS